MHRRVTRSVRTAAVAGLALLVCLALPAAASAFSDVAPDHPYAVAIEDLHTRDVVSGYVDGTFRPGAPTLRQHYAKMLDLTLGIPVSEGDVCPFGDVYVGGPGTLYPDNYIAVAAARGIVKGVDPDRFLPETPVTRAQAITMAVRALERLEGSTFDPAPTAAIAPWGDFSPAHAHNAALAQAAGLLAGLGRDAAHPDGDPGSLDPWAPMPRGEVAQLLHNALAFVPPPDDGGGGGGGGFDPSAFHAPDAALAATYAACAGTSCHSLDLYEQHVVRLARTCDACHGQPAGSPPQAAIAAFGATGAKQGCRVCHGPAAGDHAVEHLLVDPTPGECALCHAADLLALHVTGGAATCATCHGDTAPAGLKDLVDSFAAQPKNPRCEDCHRAGGPAPTAHAAADAAHLSSTAGCVGAGCHAADVRTLHRAAPKGCATCHGTSARPPTTVCTSCHNAATVHTAAHTASETADCAGCHLMYIPDEHARATSSAAAGCSACHPLPASFSWAGKCDGCHRSGGLAPSAHAAANTLHLSSKTACAGAGCHAADVRTLHQATPKGCLTCHSTSKVPTTIDCTACHDGSAHMVREPYKDSCDTCHSISGPGASLHDFHAVNRNYPCSYCHGPAAPGCAGAPCHEHSTNQIHNVDAHQAKACTFCHKSGVP